MLLKTFRYSSNLSKKLYSFQRLNSSVKTTMSWEAVCKEALVMVQQDSFIADLIEKSVLNHNSFGEAMAHNIAHQFADIIGTDKWEDLFLSVYKEHVPYHTGMGTAEEMGLLDLVATNDRDPASDGLVNPLLYFKGYKAIQCHRIAHILWHSNRKNAARAIQSRCSELFGVDIHPAAIIGEGLMIDHGTGVVIGETAIIGKNCSLLHGVTLGSTGKEKGDRHPKIGDDVLIGCGSTILGNITIGSCCKIGSGSMVLKPLPIGATAVGNPAKIVGRSMCKSAASGMDVGLRYVMTHDGLMFGNTLVATEEEKWIESSSRNYGI